MSQVFSGDSVNLPGATSVPTSGETTVVTGNFLNPPFQNAKAIVLAQLSVTLGSGTTAVSIRIRRNPNAENLQIGGTGNVNVTASTTQAFSLQIADAIPDGRPVQYAVTITPTGATGTGNIVGCNVSAFLISG